MRSFEKRFLLSILFIIIFSCAALALTSVTIVAPVNYQNVSSSMLLNATTDNEATNVTFYWIDYVSGIIVHNSSIVNDKGDDRVFNQTNFDTSDIVEGMYNVTVNATNSSGYTVAASSYVYNVTVDRTAPIVNIDIVNLSNFTTTTPTIYFNYTDNIFSYVSCLVYVNSIADTTNSSTPNDTRTGLTLSALGEGSHEYYVGCVDASDNTGVSSVYNLTVDTANPLVVAINSPLPDVNLSTGSQVFNATVTDATSNVETVIFNITNASSVVQLTGVNNADDYWDATIGINTLEEGTHTLSIFANDSLGHINNTQQLTFTVDYTAPVVYVDILNLSNFTTTTPTVYFNMSENVFDNANCAAYVNGAVDTANDSTPNNTKAGLTLNALGEGTATYYINCTDDAGNIGVSDVYSLTVDTANPLVVAINSPLPDVNLSTGAQVFNATVTDATSNVEAVLFNITNASSVVQLTGVNNADDYWDATIGINTLEEGTHTLSIFANDSLGHINNTQQLTFTVDYTAPVVYVDILNLTNFTTSTPTVYFNVSENVFDNANCAAYVNGAVDTANDSTPNNTRAGLTLSALGEGTATYYINCTDSSGNIGVSDVYSLTVDTQAPIVHVINEPTTGTVYSSTETSSITLNATVTDATIGIESVLFNVTNASLPFTEATTQVGNYFTSTLDLTSIEEGAHTIAVWAQDGADNVNNTESVSITIDNTAPVVTMVTAAFNTSTARPVISSSYTDATAATATCTLYFNNTYSNSSTFSTGVAKSLTPSSDLPDGTYTVYVNCTDGVNNVGNSSSITVGVDSGAPAVTPFITPTANGYYNDSFTLNVTVTGAPTIVEYRLNNDSTSTVITAYTDMTTSGNDFWNASIGVGSLAEWNYTIRINATDSVGNSNATETIVFGVDITGPTISSFSCTDINTGGTQSCTCSATDNSEAYGGSVSTSVSSASTSSAGTKTVTCTATDSAGLVNTSTTTYTVTDTTTTTASTGGGGTAGGVSYGVDGEYERKTWLSINAGETGSLLVENGAIGVTEVTFLASEKIWNTWLKVARTETLPGTVKPLDQRAYKYVELTTSSTMPIDKVTNVEIAFKVEKVWLTKKNIAKEGIALFHYENGQWVELDTEIVATTDDVYVHYKAKAPGFSHFAIGESTETVAVEAVPGEAEAVEGITAEEVGVSEAVEEEKVATTGLMITVLLVIVMGIAYWFITKRE